MGGYFPDRPHISTSLLHCLPNMMLCDLFLNMCDNKVILFFINNSDIVLLFFMWHIQHIFIDTYLKSTLTGLGLRTSGTYTTGPLLVHGCNPLTLCGQWMPPTERCFVSNLDKSELQWDCEGHIHTPLHSLPESKDKIPVFLLITFLKGCDYLVL